MDKIYNSLANNPRLLVLDSRSLQSYNAGHIKGSFCITVSSDGKSLQKLAGSPWSSKCWWDRDVLLVTSTASPSPSPSQSPSSSKKKKRRLEEKSSDADAVLQFLYKENLVKSLLILGGDETTTTTTAGGAKVSTFSAFAKQYPFFVTKSHKAALVSGYPSEILPQCLYLGDMENAKSESQLEELKITHVVTIHSECISFKKSIVCMFFELADEPTANIAQYFEPVYEFIQGIEMKRGRVLVHCGAGASRSATLCAAYLMRTRQWGVDHTLKYLKERRNQVNPNMGFISALLEYQKNLLCLPDKATVNSATQVCSDFKAKNNTASVHESQLEIQKDGSCLGFITLIAGRLTIFGRASSCDVVLDHASISRQHAKMEVIGNTLILTDLRSCHGTFLNGQLLESGQKIVLNDLDEVRFGASTRSYILCKRGY